MLTLIKRTQESGPLNLILALEGGEGASLIYVMMTCWQKQMHKRFNHLNNKAPSLFAYTDHITTPEVYFQVAGLDYT